MCIYHVANGVCQTKDKSCPVQYIPGADGIEAGGVLKTAQI